MAIVALLDANAIWSAAVRDTLLLAAERDLFRPLWSEQILQEMARSLKARRPDLDPARIDRTVHQMRTHFPEALVSGYEDLVATMRNHEGDRHVLAAAVRGRASMIVTWNLAHFPAAACAGYDIEVQTPDELLSQLWTGQTEEMVGVLTEQAAHLLNPPHTVLDVLATLRRSVPAFAQLAGSSGRF